MDDPSNRSGRQVSQEILDIFPKLSANDAKIRLATAAKLVEIISKDKNQEQSLSDDFFYVVERLIKGTKSVKNASKIGSTILLTEILHSFKNFRINKLLELTKKILGDVDDELSLEGVTGWTLIFTAIAQSNRLDISEKKTLSALVRFMVQLGDKKPMCNVAICNVFETLFDRQFDSEELSKILNSSLKLNERGDASPFHLYLILLIHKHPELSRVLDHIPAVDLDDPDSLTDYVRAASVYSPMVHPALVELFRFINENNRMETFWKPVFNDNLFGPNHLIKYQRLGLLVVDSILPHLDQYNASYIFSKQMMDLWMQTLSSNKHPLHGVAVQLSKDLVLNYDNYDATLQTTIVNLLIEPPGTISFDIITHSDTVNQLYLKTKAAAVETLISQTIDKIRNYRGALARDKMRSLYVNQLKDLLKSTYVTQCPENKLSVLQFFLTHGYFDVSDKDTLALCAPTTEILQDKIRNSFFKLISSACATNPEIMESVGLYVLKLMKGGIPLKDNKTLSLWKKMKKMKIKFKKLKQEGGFDKQLSIHKPLLYAIAISSFQESQDLDSLVSYFEELVECFKRSVGEVVAEGEPKWPDVLMDMMISQFPSQSFFLSSIMIKAFRLIASDISLEGIEQLKIALLVDKFEDDDDDADEDEEEEGEGENSERMDEDDEEDSDAMEDDEQDDVDDEFRAKVTLALGPAAATGDETEASIDDEEMFQLDEALSEAFRTKYSTDKNTQASLKILRSRCLDLVEIIFKSRGASLDLILSLIPVLIDATKLYNSLKDSELRSKVAKILSKLPPVKNYGSLETVNDRISIGLFKKSVDMATKMDCPSIQKSAAQICAWIIKLSKHADRNTDWIFDHLKKLLDEFFSKPNSCLSKAFFVTIFQNHSVFNFQILEALSKSVSVNLRVFTKIGGLSLLSTYLKLCQKDIVMDESIKQCLNTLKKESITGLSTSIKAEKAGLTNEYLVLLFVLHQFIPLELTMEEAQVIDSIPKQLRNSLSKVGRAAKIKVLATVDKESLKRNREENKRRSESEFNRSLETNDLLEGENGHPGGTNVDAGVESCGELQKVRPGETSSKKKKERLSRKKKAKGFFDDLDESREESKSMLETNPTPQKSTVKSEDVNMDDEVHEEAETLSNEVSQEMKSEDTSTKSTPHKSVDASENEDIEKDPSEKETLNESKSKKATPVRPHKGLESADSIKNNVAGDVEISSEKETSDNVNTSSFKAKSPISLALKSPKITKEPENLNKTKSKSPRAATPNLTPTIKSPQIKTSPNKSVSEKLESSKDEKVIDTSSDSDNVDEKVVICDSPSSNKMNQSKSSSNLSPFSNKSASSPLKTPEKRPLEKTFTPTQALPSSSKKGDSSTPTSSLTKSSSVKKAKVKTPTIEAEKTNGTNDNNLIGNNQEESSELDDQTKEEPIVKKMKIEAVSVDEDRSNSEIKTPVRATRSRTKIPRPISGEKINAELKEEQAEADDLLTEIIVPRTQAIKTPSTRSRARSTTPTNEPMTPLRRSLRNRK